jgi:hypothetical protein
VRLPASLIQHGARGGMTATCLPAKWSTFQQLRHGPFASQGEQRFSTQSATLPRFFTGSVVNPVVKASPHTTLDRCPVVPSRHLPGRLRAPLTDRPSAGHPIAEAG